MSLSLSLTFLVVVVLVLEAGLEDDLLLGAVDLAPGLDEAHHLHPGSRHRVAGREGNLFRFDVVTFS